MQARSVQQVRYRHYQPSRVNEAVQGTIPWLAETQCPIHGEIGLEDVDVRPVYSCAYDWQQPHCRKCNEPLPGVPEDESERTIHDAMMNSRPGSGQTPELLSAGSVMHEWHHRTRVPVPPMA